MIPARRPVRRSVSNTRPAARRPAAALAADVQTLEGRRLLTTMQFAAGTDLSAVEITNAAVDRIELIAGADGALDFGDVNITHDAGDGAVTVEIVDGAVIDAFTPRRGRLRLLGDRQHLPHRGRHCRRRDRRLHRDRHRVRGGRDRRPRRPRRQGLGRTRRGDRGRDRPRRVGLPVRRDAAGRRRRRDRGGRRRRGRLPLHRRRPGGRVPPCRGRGGVPGGRSTSTPTAAPSPPGTSPPSAAPGRMSGRSTSARRRTAGGPTCTSRSGTSPPRVTGRTPGMSA